MFYKSDHLSRRNLYLIIGRKFDFSSIILSLSSSLDCGSIFCMNNDDTKINLCSIATLNKGYVCMKKVFLIDALHNNK